MNLLSARLYLQPEDIKHCRKLDFELPEGARKLAVHLDYSPKHVEDREHVLRAVDTFLTYLPPDQTANIRKIYASGGSLANLITLSLFSGPERTPRGCAHRHDPNQTLVLTETDASPGFLPGPLAPGAWSALLSMHAVFCPVVLNLEISAE